MIEEKSRPANTIDLRQPARKDAASTTRGWRRRLIAGAVILIVAAAGLGGFLLLRPTAESPFPKAVREKASFSLYYPAKAPGGWYVDETSFSSAANVVTYTVYNDDAQKFLVSIQPLPSDFDFDAFKKKFFETDEFTTEAGTVFIGELSASAIGSIRTVDGSWVLINTPEVSNKPKLAELARYFTKTQ